MLSRTTRSIIIFTSLTLFSPQLSAGSNQHTAPPNIYRQAAPDQYTTPASALKKIIADLDLYESLLSHPRFLKIHYMATRIWIKQTGQDKKQRARYRREKFAPRQ